MVAFAYYHKKLYDTAELVLDDLFKRESPRRTPTSTRPTAWCTTTPTAPIKR